MFSLNVPFNIKINGLGCLFIFYQSIYKRPYLSVFEIISTNGQ